MSEFEEKGRLIETILDRIKPIPESAPNDVKDAIGAERQMLVMQAGWSNMSVAELQAMVNK
ncbi:MAG: hypothetical protein Q8P82_01055 [bacterium]|nr:hypothetical protein [bacterium]